MTGLYPHNHGVLSNPTRDAIPTALPADRQTWAERLRNAGYTTSYAGKWHIDGTTGAEAGFEPLTTWDHSGDQTLDSTDYREHAAEYGVDPDAVTVDRVDAPSAGTVDIPPEATQTGYLAERTIERLELLATADEPFVHRLDFPGPHAPFVVPASVAARYDPEDIDPWPSFRETFDGKPEVHAIHNTYYGQEDLTWDDWAPAVAHYFAFETLIEEQFARVLDALDSLGLADDTVVIRTSDHGECVGAHRQWGKGPMMYEDLYRVPFLIRWPGVTASGSTSEAFVELQDLHPTLCDLAGIDVPDGDGRSLRPVFESATGGGTPDVPNGWRTAAFAEYHGEPETLITQRMVRTDRYKFVFNGPCRNELYDLDDDPNELTNLIDHPEYETVRQRLAERLGDWMERTDDHVSCHRFRNRCVE